MSYIKKILKNDYATILLAGILTGLLSTVSLAPFNYPLTVYFCLWPLFFTASRFRNSFWKMFLSGAVASLFLCVFSFYWMLHLFQEFGGMNILVALVLFIPYTVVLNLKIPLFVILFGVSRRSFFRSAMPRWFAAAALGTLADYISPQIFPWYWGNLIAGNDWILQMAEFTGITGLTFLVFALSYFLYHLAEFIFAPQRLFYHEMRAGSDGEKPGFIALRLRRLFHTKSHVSSLWKKLLPAPLIFLLCLFAGAIIKYRAEELQKTLPRIRVAMIQPNAPLEKQGAVPDFAIYELITKTIPRLAQKAAQMSDGKLDLIVLPESAVPYYTTQDNFVTRRTDTYHLEFEHMAQLLGYNWNTEVFLNEIALELARDRVSGRPRIEAYNSSVLFSRDGVRRDFYHKRELLAWGEYIPGVEFLEKTGLIFLVPEIVRYSRFGRGKESSLIAYSRRNIDTPSRFEKPLEEKEVALLSPAELRKKFPTDRVFNPTGRFLPLICYEVLKPAYIRTFFENAENPDFIVNITQDGWYGKTVESFQHYELGRIRSVETRRALVRSTNSGASGFVDIAGNYVTPLVGPRFSAQEEEEVQIWDVPINRSKKTIFVLFGELWLLLPAAVFLGFTARKLLKNRQRPQTKKKVKKKKK